MKQLITYIFLLLALISLVHITKEVVSFSKDIIILNEYQMDAKIRQERMLYPAVKISNIQENVTVYYPNEDTGVVDAIESTATGFSIQYDPSEDISFIITNDHFCAGVSDDSSLIIEDYKQSIIGISNEYMPAKILYTAPELDLCLIEAAGHIRPAIIADYNYKPELFEKIFIVGGPTGNFPIIIDTYMSSTVSRDDIMIGALAVEGNEFLVISEQIFPGHSGSAAFNQDGEVIGVVFASLETYGGLAISHKDIFKLLFDYQNSI
jgi:S1-C subfamily serine protease